MTTHLAEAPPANPSGAHRLARDARRELDDARDILADAVGADPGGVIFTSGGTEADNLAIGGVLRARPGVAVCSAVEHHAVHDPVDQSGGAFVPVDPAGRVTPAALEDTLARLEAEGRPVSVVSIMIANNETGVVQPVAELAEVVRRRWPQVVVHTDAVQGLPWLPLASLLDGVDLVTVSAHKLGGPMGVGALVRRADVPLAALALGGSQERGLRGGTQNVVGICGFAAAVAATAAARSVEVPAVTALRDRLAAGLVEAVDGLTLTVPGDVERLPSVVHCCIGGIESEELLFLLEREGVMASAASSCASGAQQVSHVLGAMGISPELARGSLRLSLGVTSTSAEVDAAVAAVAAGVARLRSHGGPVAGTDAERAPA